MKIDNKHNQCAWNEPIQMLKILYTNSNFWQRRSKQIYMWHTINDHNTNNTQRFRLKKNRINTEMKVRDCSEK